MADLAWIFAALLATGAAGGAPDRPEARALLAEVVAYRTVAGQGEVPAMARHLEQVFIEGGFDPADVQVEPLGETASLTVRYRGPPGTALSPVVFLAHMDVVDADAAEWKTDPWRVTEVDGRLHGRGVVDNKYGLVALVDAFLRLKREGHVPSRDLVLAFSGDEETTQATTRRLAEALRGAAFAVNSDAGGGFQAPGAPPLYYMQVAEKTYASFEIIARGEGGHSATPHPDNAIHKLATALTRIAGHRFPARWNEPSLAAIGSYASHPDPAIAAAAASFAQTPGNPEALAVLEREHWIDRELRTTCVPTLLSAGLAENVLPTRASATINCRIFPGETIAATRDALAGAIGDPSIGITVLGDPVESPELPIPDEAMQALQQVLAVRAPGATPIPYMEAGSTDGLRFRRNGIPTIGAAPLIVTSEMDLGFHGPDEGLPVDDFERGLEHYYLYIKALDGDRPR